MNGEWRNREWRMANAGDKTIRYSPFAIRPKDRPMSPSAPENDYDSALSGWFVRPRTEAEEDDLLGSGMPSIGPEILERVREWTREEPEP